MQNSKLRSVIVGLSATILFWVILFGATSAIRTALVSATIAAAGIGDDSVAMSATGLLVIGLGGTAVVAANDALTGASFAAPLLLVPILYWSFLRFASKRFTPTNQSRLVSGQFTALGAGLAIVLIVKLSDGLQTVAGSTVQVSYVWILPALIAALIGFFAVPGARDSISWQLAANTTTTLVGAFRGFAGFLIFLSVAGLSYMALRMGTGAMNSIELWQWALIVLAIAAAVPSAAAAGLPIILGAGVVAAQSAFGTPLTQSGFFTDYEWVRWAAIGVAWLVVVIVAFKRANAGQVSKQYWWQYPLVFAFLGAFIAWATSIRAVGQIDLAIWKGTLGFIAGAEFLGSLALFALAGLVFGIVSHPVLQTFVKAITRTVGAPVARAAIGFKRTFTLGNISKLDRARSGYRALPYVARKLVKYSVALSLVAVSFFSGPVLASATSGLYQNENSPENNLVATLKTGDPKLGAHLYNLDNEKFQFLESTGLGESASVEVKKDEKSGKVTVSWGDYSITLSARKAYYLDDFLGVIPQYEGVIEETKLPSVRLKFGDQNLAYADVNGKPVAVYDLVFLPGNVALKAGTDEQGYLESNSVVADVSKDQTVAMQITVAEGKQEEIAKAAQDYMVDNVDCNDFSFGKTSSVKVGTKVSGSELPKLVSTGTGKCNYEDYFGELTPISFKYVATGAYNLESSEWSWTYKFN
jgi:hypothetical protein